MRATGSGSPEQGLGPVLCRLGFKELAQHGFKKLNLFHDESGFRQAGKDAHFKRGLAGNVMNQIFQIEVAVFGQPDGLQPLLGGGPA